MVNFVVVSGGLNRSISFVDSLQGKLFHVMKSRIRLSSSFNRVSLWQILYARLTRARIQATFLDQGETLTSVS